MNLKKGYSRFLCKVLVFFMVFQSWPLMELSRHCEWSQDRFFENLDRFISFFAPSQAMAAEDFLIAVDDSSNIYYAKSNGDGTFEDYRLVDHLGGSYSRAVAIADFNGDGESDMVVGRGISATAYFYLFVNDGNNVFTKSQLAGTLGNANSHAMDMAAGDFNHDGLPDFIANGNESTTGVFLNDGQGGFIKYELELGSQGRGMDTADFDHDGNLDIVRARCGSGYIDVYPGNGDGTFGEAIRVGDAGSDPYGVAAGDFDNDGHADVIANAGSNGDPYLYVGNGDNTFSSGISVASLDFNLHGCFDAYDYNADGNLDMVAVSYTGKRVLFYPGNGDGTFGTPVEIGSTSTNSLGISALPSTPPAGDPAAVFTPLTQTLSTGKAAVFDGSGSLDPDGTIADYLWDFGDGSTESGSGPAVGGATHVYAQEGTYFPTLQVVDDNGKRNIAVGRVIVSGDTPTIDTSPVQLGEESAAGGEWNVTLNGQDYATDSEGVSVYEWIFEDVSVDFESGNADDWTVDAGSWSIDDSSPISGAYSYLQANASTAYTPTYLEKWFQKDLVIEADANLISGNYEQVLVLFRSKDSENGYEYLLCGRNNSDVLLYKMVNGGRTQLVEYNLPDTFPSCPIDVGHTYRVKIVCQGPMISFFLDDALLFSFEDDTFEQGRVGFSTYYTSAAFDNLAIRESAEGQIATRTYPEGANSFELSVIDSAGQAAAGTIPVTLAAGQPPVSNAGGPYSVDEFSGNTSHGLWTVALNGSASFDNESCISKYVWDLGKETFDGAVFDSERLIVGGEVSQADGIAVTGDGNWGASYVFSRKSVARANGTAVEIKVNQTSNGNAMVGLKNDTTEYHYNQMPYAVYFSSRNVYVYEDGSNRGDTRIDYSLNTWYDVHIELKPDQGALYYLRQSGQSDWTLLYDSDYGSETVLKWGADIQSGTFLMDDVQRFAGGETPSCDFAGPDTYPVSLTVFDQIGQSTVSATTVTTQASAVPVPKFNPDRTLTEIDASEGTWLVDFDASESQDDHGILRYEWDFDAGDGIQVDDAGATPTATHTYAAPGVYTVTLRVIDHALQTAEATATVTILSSDPPVADASGPYVFDESAAEYGIWVSELDASGSSDDFGIVQYIWDLGVAFHNFAGNAIDGRQWIYSSGTDIQNDGTRITGSGSWGSQYLFTRQNSSRIDGRTFFQARINPENTSGNQYGMWGFKNTSTNYNYNQMPHAIYFFNNTIHIFEDGSNRGNYGSYDRNTQYDIKIVLKSQGALYYYKPASSDDWTLLYDSDYSDMFDLKAGATISHGTFLVEEIQTSRVCTGAQPRIEMYEPGTYDVQLTVIDRADKADTDTTTLVVENGQPPAAEAGSDISAEINYPVYMDAGNSSDDREIARYEWDFGDGTVVSGTSPYHIYNQEGEYTVTLTVTDHCNQSSVDTLTVSVVSGEAPVANAGGPYVAGAGGPPAYFNGNSSTDDFGVAKYLWDVDDAVDSDGDGNFVNDMDVVGRNPFFTYAAQGVYNVTLTVLDGAGNSHSDSTTVNVAANLAPEAICVPWMATDPLSFHETYNGRSIRLKAITRDAGDLTYQWDFGDGSPPYPETPAKVSNKYAIEASHVYPDSPAETPYIATLTVWDSQGLSGSDQYPVMVRPDDLETRTNVAIDGGLWWLHKNQKRTDGHWESHGSYYASPTASALQAFEINGHLQNGDHQEDPYVETVDRGFVYLFTTLRSLDIDMETYGDPDTNGNGIGIEVSSNRAIYEGGMVMDAIVSSNSPLAFAVTGGTDVNGRSYHEIVTDMVDMYAWGQSDSGGWRYSWNQAPDNSACQWAAIGMIAAEENFYIEIPRWVKERNDHWLSSSYNGTGFGYTGSGNGVATTPSGMVQLAFSDKTTADPRWSTAEDYIANNWFWQDNNYYGAYALVKALRLAQPEPVQILDATGLDWYNDSDTGLRKRVVDQQAASGSNWGSWGSAGYGGRGLDTAWAVIMLTPTLFVRPPVADAGDDIIWAYDTPLAFDASGSHHTDPLRSIVKYEWDFDGDGDWDLQTTDPQDPGATITFEDPHPDTVGDPAQVFIARLRVTDNNDPAQTDIDTRRLTITEPPHAPFADPGGPYLVTAGIPFALDGSGSKDIDPGDSITRFEWDLDNDGAWFDDVDLDTPQATANYQYDTPGTYYIGLRVWDNGAFNPVGCTVGVDCDPLVSEPAFTRVIVEPNLPPVAEAGGPYEVNEGDPLELDGSNSSDPNGDILTFAWDLDGDGEHDDSTQVQPTRTWMDDGSYPVSLTVSDSLLSDTDSAIVTVLDLSPAADFGWTPEVPSEGQAVHFTDASTSPADAIASWAWNFDGLGTSAEQNPDFTFNSDGTYNVSLTVTDDDGSTDTVVKTVTVADLGPQAALDGDTILAPSQPGSYNAGASSSHPDSIVSYEWDWEYDGSNFVPSGDAGAVQQHAWTTVGTYVVAVRVTDSDGSQDIAALAVTIEPSGPVADAGEDQTLLKDSPRSRGQVLLDGSDSHDPNGDPLVHMWLGPFGTLFGESVEALVPEGVYTVSLIVSDGTAMSEVDTADIEIMPCFEIAARPKAGKVQLTWTHIEGTERYDVYRTTEDDPTNFEKIAETISTYATYLDVDIVNETTYLYTVAALSQEETCHSGVISAHPTTLRSRTPINYDPVIYSTPIGHGTEGIVYNYDVNATDPNVDTLVYLLLDAPDDMGIDSQTGRIQWLPGETGTVDVTVAAEDAAGVKDIQSFSIEVGEIPPMNRPPAIVSDPVENALEDARYAYDVEAEDPDQGDVLTYSLVLHPDGMAIDSATGLVQWDPVQTDVGENRVTVIVTDSEGATDEQSFVVLVENVNDAPVIAPIDDRSMIEGGTLLVPVSATDDDGDAIVLSTTGLPDFGSFTDYGDGSAQLSFQPGTSHDGQYTIVINATDGKLSGTETFVLTVANQNRPPEITSTPEYNATENEPYVYTVVAEDPDNDSLALTLENGPAGMTLDAGTSELRWTPDNDDVGPHSVTVRATDPGGLFDEQTFTLTVLNVNDPPVIDDIADRSMDENTTLTISITATDPDDGDTLVLSFIGLPNFAEFTETGNGRGELVFTPSFNDSGEWPFAAYASDGESTTGATATLTVRNVNRAPVADVGGPYAEVVETPVNFDGSLSHDPDDEAIAFAWDFGDGSDIATAMKPIHAYAEVGTYTATLTVSDNDGETATVETTVVIHPTPVVDLQPVGMDVSRVVIDPQTLEISGSLDVTVANNGQTDVFRSYALAVFEDVNANQSFDPGVDEVLGIKEITSGPEAGGQTIVYVEISGNAEFVDNLIYVMADAGNAIEETNEENNVTHSMAECEYNPPVADFSPEIKWEWNGGQTLPESNQVAMAPVVAQTNDDNADGAIDDADTPDVVFISFDPASSDWRGTLRIVSGKDGSEIVTVTGEENHVGTFSQLALGDIDGDGSVEIVAEMHQGGLIAFGNDGEVQWRIDQQAASLPATTYPYGMGAPAIADIDADGAPEIIFGKNVFNNDGTLRWMGTGPYLGQNHPNGFHGESVSDYFSYAVNLDLSPGLEIVAGASAYDANGTLLWVNETVGDGYTAVGNFNNDPYPEIAIVHDDGNGAADVFLLDYQGQIVWGPVPLPGGGVGGPPTVADVDGDGEPEIGVAGMDYYTVFDTDGTVLWQAPTEDHSSNFTGSSTFDFNGDGHTEIVYMDEQDLWVFDGSTGNVVFNTPNSSTTAFEYPVVADIDNDHQADIVICANTTRGGIHNGIRVYQGVNDSWVNTRKIWNQHAYSITNVNDDGTIPQYPANNWDTYNNFRCNQSPEALACVDLSASYLRIDPADLPDSFDLITRIGNSGALDVAPGIDVAFYAGDPDDGGALLETAIIDEQLNPGAYADIRFTIEQPDEGLIELFVRADDDGSGNGKIREIDEDNNKAGATFDIRLPNPPEITSAPVTDAATGEAYVYDVEAVDLDENDVLTFSLPIAPAGMAIDAESGLIQWTPVRDQQGLHNVTVQVMDLTRATDIQEFIIDVFEGANHNPVFTSVPVESAFEYEQYEYQLAAEDPDGDYVDFELATFPDDMAITPDGLILWPDTGERPESVEIVVRATDGHGGEALQSWTITVQEYVPPTLQVTATPRLVYVGETVQIQVTVSDDRPLQSLDLDINGDLVPLTDGQAQYVSPAIGAYQATATGVDLHGNTIVGQASFYTPDPSDDQPPTVAITGPENNSNITAPTDIVGTVQDDRGVANYKLEYAPVVDVNLGTLQSDNYVELESRDGGVIDDVLGTFDPTLIRNDEYFIRLTAWDYNGNSASTGILLSVSGNLKLGNFRLEFVDLSIPLVGIPIQVTRIYDTLDANIQGSFGYGWSLGAYDADIRETVVQNGPCLFGNCPPIKKGSRVYLTTPDGRRVGFTFEPEPAICGLFGCTYYPRFKADPGVYETLETPESNSNIIALDSEGNAVNAFVAIAYNPDTYILTLKNGLKYQYDQFEGLKTITDRNNNHVTFTEDGILHSSGVSIHFVREDQGRIIKIIEPDDPKDSNPPGELVYDYDPDTGNLTVFHNQENHITLYSYGCLSSPHYLTDIDDPTGTPIIKNVYSDKGHIIAQCDAQGNVTTLEGCIELSSDSIEKRTTYTNARGYRTDLLYDEYGNIVMERRYGDDGEILETTRSFMPGTDLMLSETDPEGNINTFTYDKQGNIETQNLPGPNGLRTWTYTYTRCNKVETVTDPLNRVTQYEYDANCNLRFKNDPGGGITEYRYNEHGHNTHFIDAEGNTWEIHYDSVGLPTGITDPLGNSSNFKYNWSGEMLYKIDRNGHRIDYEYDQCHRKIRETWNTIPSRTLFFEYNDNGQITFASDPDSSVSFDYWLTGELRNFESTGIPGIGTIRLSYDYDDNGNLIQVADDIGGRTEYRYDAFDRIDSIRQSSSKGLIHEKRVDIDHHPFGMVETVRRYADIGANTPVAQTTFSYDCGSCPSRISAIEHRRMLDNNIIEHLEFVRDDFGNILSRSDTEGDHIYAYDNMNRLTSADHPDGGLLPDESYHYDLVGNRLASHQSSTYAYSYQYPYNAGGNQLRQDDSYNYEYDRNGNLVLQVNRTTGAYFEYAYDHRNRMVTLNHFDAGGTLLKSQSQLYDALNRRIGVINNGDVSGYVFERKNPLIKFNGDGDVVEYRMYDQYMDGVYAIDTPTNTHWTLRDQVGSIMATLSNDGTQLSRIHYDSYGRIMAESGIDTNFELRYTARPFDRENGLHYARARFYNPIVGMFTQEDPKWPRRYSYARNNPTHFVDPTGEIAIATRAVLSSHFHLYSATTQAVLYRAAVYELLTIAVVVGCVGGGIQLRENEFDNDTLRMIFRIINGLIRQLGIRACLLLAGI